MLTRPQPGECAEHLTAYIRAAPEGDVLQHLASQGEEVAALYRGFSESQAGFRYAPGKWSLKDLLQHLTDCERIFAYRCLRIGRGDATPLPGFEENAYAVAAHADGRTVASLLEEFLVTRESTLALFRSLSGDAWLIQGQSNGKPVTARCFPFVCLGHAAHHLQVIRERYLPGLK